MNCSRAFEIDLEDLLSEPESPELRALEAHSESCPDCAGELALQRGLLSRLSPEPQKQAHPSDALLLRFRRDPEALPDAERRGVLAHLRDCAPCDNAYQATLALVPEPQRSPWKSFLQTLRGWLLPSALPVWAPSAVALLLVLGVVVRMDPFGEGPLELGPSTRSGLPTEFATEVDLLPGARAELSLYGLEDTDVVLLRFEVPSALQGQEVEARVLLESGALIDSGAMLWDPDDASVGVLDLAAGSLERDSYIVELTSEAGETARYPLDVR